MGPYKTLSDRIPVLLAPMSGVTDAPFRRQANFFGASATITEMVAGEDLVAGRREALQRFRRPEEHAPYVVQLVGREAAPLEAGARLAFHAGADVIDINMGCPSRRVTGGLSGSALMRDLDKAETLIAAVMKGAHGTPVTLKMRLGWDRQSLNADELGKRAEALGVELITVHGRTRQEFYEGEADWASIKTVVDVVSVPVIANGDICDAKTARQALSLSGGQGVMVGRAATGLAWLPSSIEIALASDNDQLTVPPLAVRLESLCEQLSDSISLYGESVGVRTLRKHLAAAFDFFSLEFPEQAIPIQNQKKQACQSTNREELNQLIRKANEFDLEMAV